MPSTYSTSLGLELIGNGEQAGTWGTTTNSNLGTLLEQAIAGVESITLTGGDYTLTDYNGLPDQARNAVLVFGGLLAAPCNVIAPAVEKVYIVRNFSNATITIKTASGNGVAIANAASEVIFCDSTNFYSATQFNYIDGNLTVSGTAYANNLVATNNITFGKDLFANASTGQIYLPVGTQAQRTGAPINGLIRYNTTDQIYEGYQNNVWIKFTTSPQGNYTISYLVAAGGGGGGGGFSDGNVPSGAGGAGGVLAASTTFIAGTTYSIIIGAGGALQTQGSTSYLASPGPVYIANCTGGGYGGPNYDDYRGAGGNGGSGGGAGRSASAGTGTAGQGFNGNGYSGGGAGAIGNGTVGGVGLYSGISGTGTYYGGGGGGGAGSPETAGALGGAGGGGQSGNTFGSPGPNGISGTVNSGGGGGGNGGYVTSGGSGGSGICILSVPTINYSGSYTGSPVVTTSGVNTILTFNSAGTYTA
jgi:hypothetical protein